MERLEEPDEGSREDQLIFSVARIYEFINRSHVFIDGNKRTALVVAFEICLMNDYYCRKIKKETEVEFSKRIASTTIEEVGLDEVRNYFNERVIPLKEYAFDNLERKSIICPRCGNNHRIKNRFCSCGLRIDVIKFKVKGMLDEYWSNFSQKDIDNFYRRR